MAEAARSLASVDVGDDVVSRIAVDRERALGAAEDDLRGVAATRRAVDVDGRSRPASGRTARRLKRASFRSRTRAWPRENTTGRRRHALGRASAPDAHR